MLIRPAGVPKVVIGDLVSVSQPWINDGAPIPCIVKYIFHSNQQPLSIESTYAANELLSLTVPTLFLVSPGGIGVKTKLDLIRFHVPLAAMTSADKAEGEYSKLNPIKSKGSWLSWLDEKTKKLTEAYENLAKDPKIAPQVEGTMIYEDDVVKVLFNDTLFQSILKQKFSNNSNEGVEKKNAFDRFMPVTPLSQLLTKYTVHRAMFMDYIRLIKEGTSWNVLQRGPYYIRPIAEQQLIIEFLQSTDILTEEVALDMLRMISMAHYLNLHPGWLPRLSKHYGLTLVNQQAASEYLVHVDKKRMFVPPLYSEHPILLNLQKHGEVQNAESGFAAQHLQHSDDLFSRYQWSDHVAWAVDPQGVTEVDDAVGTNGDGWLHVHIADPTSSMPSFIAHNRVSTIYLPDNVIRMLPTHLTNQHSLNRAKYVLTFSAKFGPGGDIVDYNIRPATLKHGTHQLTYEQAQAGLESENQEMQSLTLIRDMTEKHLEWRKSHGMIDTNLPNTDVQVIAGKHHYYEPNLYHGTDLVLDPETGNYLRLFHRHGMLQPYSKMHIRDVISEAMIIAGRVACAYALDQGIQIPFVVHERPTDLPIPPEIFVNRQDESLALRLARMCNIRGAFFRPAGISLTPGEGHWSMGLKAYTRVTSPLRRYLDMLIHEQFRLHWNQKPLQDLHKLDLDSVSLKSHWIKSLMNNAQRYWLHRALAIINTQKQVSGDKAEHSNVVFQGILVNATNPDNVGIMLTHPLYSLVYAHFPPALQIRQRGVPVLSIVPRNLRGPLKTEELINRNTNFTPPQTAAEYIEEGQEIRFTVGFVDVARRTLRECRLVLHQEKDIFFN